MNIDKVIEIYLAIDDFMIAHSSQIQQLRLNSSLNCQRFRASKLSDSEMITITRHKL